MRLDPVLDSFYVLGSLWGAVTGSPVCHSNVGGLPHTAREEAPTAAKVTAFVDVAVIPMDTERVLSSQIVLVEGGRITAVGPASQVRVPAGAMRIDGRGKYLMPGLTDMHTHFLHGNVDEKHAPLLFSFLANGVTAIRNTTPVSGEATRTFRNSEAAALSPYIYIAGRMHEFARSGLSSDSTAAAYKAAGYDFLMETGSDSIQAAAFRLGLPRGIHIPHGGAFDQMLSFGRGTAVEHLYRYWSALGLPDRGEPGKVAERTPADVTAADIQKLAAATRQAGIWITPTLYCMGGTRTDPRSVLLRQIVKGLQDEGVGLLLAGDDVGDVHDELAALVRAGLSPYQALLTGTRNVAQYLGLSDERGTVAVGKQADLVLLYGDPLENIRHTREPAGVMRAGRWFDRAELDQRLLASPKKWFALTVSAHPNRTGSGSGRPSLLASITKEQSPKVRGHMGTFEALADSLEAARSSGPDSASTSQRLLRLMTDELGAISSALTPEQHVVFDPIARVWLREQARKGYPAVIPGVAPAP